MNCRRYNRTRCHRKSASGWLRPLPDNSRLRGGRQTRSQSSALSRTLLEQGSLSIGFTGGSPTPRLCSFLRKWLKCLRYIVRYLSRQIRALEWLMESEKQYIFLHGGNLNLYLYKLKISLITSLVLSIETFKWDTFWMKIKFYFYNEWNVLKIYRFNLRNIKMF